MTQHNAAVPHDQRIEFRVGINSGDVIVEGGDIHGDGVNIAARLEGIAEPGGICVSAIVHDQVRGRLDCAFDDIGEQSLKNIARPVRVYKVGPTCPHPNPPPQAGEGVRRDSGGRVGAEASLPLPDKPSLAVLPFQNMSGDPEQEYFADGMVEEITTAIARLPWLFVIARNSSFTYKGKSVDVKQVARELGVRYVLEGSVRKAGNRVRITGQLIDTASGAHIWADRFDGMLDDIFELQDQVASSVAGAIAPKLRYAEIERASRKPTESLDAYDLYLRALTRVRHFSDESFAEAIDLLRQALAIDPFYVSAAALLSWSHNQRRIGGWGTVSTADIAEAVRLARWALDAGRDDPDTLWQSGYALYRLAGETGLAMAALDRAVALNPNAAIAWVAKGIVHAHRNQPEAAIQSLDRALRLSPFDPLGYYTTGGLALVHLSTRRFETAIEWADRALHDNPRLLFVKQTKTLALAYLDRLDEARAEVARILAMHPKQTIASFREMHEPSMVPELVDFYVAGLRLAGLPEA
jgi:TolB-like protein